MTIMKKNNYTLKEILFGLRTEYLKLTEQLNTLKQYISKDENNIENIDIFLTKPNEIENIAIMCILQTRKNSVEKIIIELESSLHNKKTSIKKIEGIHTFKEYPQLITASKRQEFNECIYNICNEDFVKNSEDIYSGIEYNSKLFLSINTNHIYASENPKISIDYTPHIGDFIHAYGFKKVITKEDIERSFNMIYPKDRFSEYYQNLIENSTSSSKTLDIIGNFSNSQSADLEIIEESKKLILRKK